MLLCYDESLLRPARYIGAARSPPHTRSLIQGKNRLSQETPLLGHLPVRPCRSNLSLRAGSPPCNPAILSPNPATHLLANNHSSRPSQRRHCPRHLRTHRLLLLATPDMARTSRLLLQRHPREILRLGDFAISRLLHQLSPQAPPKSCNTIVTHTRVNVLSRYASRCVSTPRAFGLLYSYL